MKTLILNADGKPLSVIDFRRAIVLDSQNLNVRSLSYYQKTISSTRGEVKIPAVMVYFRYISVKSKRFPSKRAIRLRDKNTCGYCGLYLDKSQLTIDHIVPVSRFDDKSQANTWENQISCCKKCNTCKGNRTPGEAGMELRSVPKNVDILFLLENIPEEWGAYI
jgi:5-methylcytosine-specific restriction endonuclease McrA